MNLYMSYDLTGFKQAIADGTDELFNHTHSLTEQIGSLIECGEHDLEKGFCSSFQIYSSNGEIIFNSLGDV